ncbi:Tn7-like element transposition protein TnsE [Heyndrickxia oleronia]|uniref:Tn7-like element transposition protein TnsE n=1 Tax=Heyndrickxia oleronia TaxID=38875 RepID=UPI002286CF5C|nr:Tn7-like element transposition protein TnsE [Heyndrickxia oleronia]MEC1375641.1 Tn7-like element transposition protein TnsE [Heyndrickxia oleronia]
MAGYKFESFIQMIKVLSNHFLNLSISMNIVFLPFNRSFSFLPNGMRRAALIVKINNNGKINYIEAAAPDNYSLSTLIVPSLGSQEKDEKMIRTLLNNIVNASGRWKKDFMGEFSHIKLKHLKQTHEICAKRMYKCL